MIGPMIKSLLKMTLLFSMAAQANVRIDNCQKFIAKHGIEKRQLSSIYKCEKSPDSSMDYRKGDIKSGLVCLFEARDNNSWVLVGDVKVTDGLFNTEAIKENLFLQVSRSHKSLWGKISDASYFPEEVEQLSYQEVQSDLPDTIERWESDKRNARIEVKKSVQVRGWNQKIKTRKVFIELKDMNLKFDNFILNSHRGFQCSKLF